MLIHTVDRRSEIWCAIAGLIVVKIAQGVVVVKYCLTKWTNTLQSPIVKDVEIAFKDPFQAVYFNSNICIKSATFNDVGQVL